MEDTKRIIEINGIKVEVDMRTAKRVDQYRVGDAVKVLVKEYSTYKSHLGMIVGFDEFKALPTLIIAYLNVSMWEKDPLKFVYINSESKDVEICAHSPEDIGFEKADVTHQFEKGIQTHKSAILELEQKQKYFETMFGKYFQKQA